MRTMNRLIAALLLGTTILTLAACGGSTPSASQTTLPSSSATSAPVAVQPSATSSAASSNIASPAATTAAGSTATTGSALAQLDRPYAALPQSRTPEGYYALGRPDAPIVLTHYSDFL